MRAVRPTFFSKMPSLIPSGKNTEVTEDEQALYAMSKSRGWQVFKESMSRAGDELEAINRNAISQGSALEEIGRNAIVISLAQGVIERLLNKVSDATEACEKNE